MLVADEDAMRLIPAHAGKTRLELNAHGEPPAHPRSRGENGYIYVYPWSSDGSSPLTRGKHVPLIKLAPDRGLIPAHAGKTRRNARSGHAHPAHPRSRGENGLWCSSFGLFPGSSPLTRGKLGLSVSFVSLCRLIPAHAGKTVLHVMPPWSWRAHPRSRGENQ